MGLEVILLLRSFIEEYLDLAQCLFLLLHHIKKVLHSQFHNFIHLVLEILVGLPQLVIVMLVTMEVVFSMIKQ